LEVQVESELEAWVLVESELEESELEVWVQVESTVSVEVLELVL
jgi:hypothetical protein